MLKGIADVRPEIAKVVALEGETVGQYEKAVGQFKNGGMSSQALAKVISQSIVPALQAARVRLKAVNGVPAEHQPLVSSAEEYLAPARRELAAAGGRAAQVEHGRVAGRGSVRTGVARSAGEAQGRAREISAGPPGSSGRTNPPDSGHNRQACLCRSWSVPVPSLEIV